MIAKQVSGNAQLLSGQTLFQNTDPQTSGSIYNVGSSIINGETYYSFSISEGTTFGKFVQKDKTYVTTSTPVGSTVINVDSTVGFDTAGQLNVGDYSYTYTGKNYTQFTGITTTTDLIGLGSTVTQGPNAFAYNDDTLVTCLLYTSPSPRDY